MHITPDAAGLIAQVFPALLIALLIEGRHTPKWKARWVRLANHLLRVLAIASASASSFACVAAYAMKYEHVILDVVVTASLWALCLAFTVVISQHLGAEVDDLFDESGRRQAKPMVASKR